MSGSDEFESDGDQVPRKDTTLSALLKKQAYISTSTLEDSVDDSLKKRKRGAGKAPLYWFSSKALPSNTSLGIYRAVFTDAEQAQESDILDLIRNKQLTPKAPPKATQSNNGVPLPTAYAGPHMFMCMIGGGHFAAMVVSLAPRTRSNGNGPLTREATVLAHKTFHRYTTRRKQGGSQSANDSAKGAAHSAGADLRRYNEQALNDEVRMLLHDWKGMIDTSELIFVRATGITSRRTLFGPYDDQVLRQSDARIRGFPFSTRRATQNELMRAFVELTRVKVQVVDEAAIAAAAAAQAEAIQQAAAQKAFKAITPTTPKLSEEEEMALLHTTQIQAFIRRSKLPALITYLKTNNISPDFLFYPPDSQQNHHAPNSLHLASSLNSPTLVLGLLLKAGADPTTLNKDTKAAFDLAGDRATRDAFRVARSELSEERWDWDSSHIPAALSRMDAEARDAREKTEATVAEDERRKAEERRLKEEGPKVADGGPLGKAAGRGRMQALGMVAKTAQERREEEAKGLTPEMRMRLDRERRARAAEERMKKFAQGGGS